MSLSDTQVILLEEMIDKNSLRAVLAALSDIVHAKAVHVQENWQDDELAAKWRKAGTIIDRAEANQAIRAVP